MADLSVGLGTAIGLQGRTNIAEKVAATQGQMVTQMAKMQAKQQKDEEDAFKLLRRSITTPKDLHPLTQKPAIDLMTNATMQLLKLKTQKPDGYAIDQEEVVDGYLTRLADIQRISGNYKEFDKATKQPGQWLSPEQRAIKANMDNSSRLEDFAQKSVKEGNPAFNPETLTIGQVTTEKFLDPRNQLDRDFGNIKVALSGEISKQGENKYREGVILRTEREAIKWAADNNTDIPPSLEAVTKQHMAEPSFVKQYADISKISLAGEDPSNLSPAKYDEIQKRMEEEGVEFLTKRYQNVGGIKVNIVNKPAEAENTYYGPGRNVSMRPTTLSIGGKNVSRNKVIMAAIQPAAKDFGALAISRGTVTGSGKNAFYKVTGKNAKGQDIVVATGTQTIPEGQAKLTSIVVQPYITRTGVTSEGKSVVYDEIVFAEDDVRKATGFKSYYEFGGGSYYEPVDSKPNLEFNVGGKDVVASRKDALDWYKDFTKKLNTYHGKYKATANAQLYQKLSDLNSGKITEGEMKDWIDNFNFDN